MMFESASFNSAECDYHESAEGDTQMSSSSSNLPRWAKIALYNMITRRMNDFVLGRTIMREWELSTTQGRKKGLSACTAVR